MDEECQQSLLTDVSMNVSSNLSQMYKMNFSDNKIHLILFLMDNAEINSDHAQCIKSLSKLTNILPIISKGDLFDEIGIKMIKEALLRSSKNQGIEWFDVREALKGKVNRPVSEIVKSFLGPCPPFLIINANNCLIEDSRPTYVRKYSWGLQDVEDQSITDLRVFYTMVFGYLALGLRERTDRLMQRYKQAIKQRMSKRQKTISVFKGFAVGFGVGIAIATASTILLAKTKK